jgi:hypothetical protein
MNIEFDPIDPFRIAGTKERRIGEYQLLSLTVGD